MRWPFVSPAIFTISSVLGCRSPSVVPPVVPDKQPVVAAPTNPCKTSGLREVAKLQSSINVKLYWSAELKGIEKRVAEIRRFFSPLVKESNGKLTFESIEITSEATRDEAKDVGILERDDGDAGRGMFGIAYLYRDEREAIPALSLQDSAGLGFWAINKIREMGFRGDKTGHRIGVLTGTNEIALSDANLVARNPAQGKGPSIQGIAEQALDFYKLVPVDVRGGQEAIDSSLAGLIVTQPGRTVMDAELKRIDEFLMRGGKTAAIIAGATNIKASDPTMTATLDRHGLDHLLSGYGIEMRNDLVLDRLGSFSIHVQSNRGLLTIFLPGAIVLQNPEDVGPRDMLIDTASGPFFRINELAVPYASTLVPHPDKQPGAKMRELLHSSPNSQSLETNPVSLSFQNLTLDGEGNRESKTLAISVEGSLRSAFAPAAPPAKARLLTISSAQFLANPFARAGNQPPESKELGDEDLLAMSMPYAQKHLTASILTFKNIMDWMTVDDDLLACSAQKVE